MENKPIFLSMAAIDGKKAEQNQWLPKELFPLRTHRITAPGRADDCDEFSGQYRKGKVRQRLCLAFRTVICVMDIF